jgi:hypothetical protein
MGVPPSGFAPRAGEASLSREGVDDTALPAARMKQKFHSQVKMERIFFF